MKANRAVSAREVAFRKALWHAGARGYRINSKLPGRPDLVFPGLRIAIFVHGCFWHGCPVCSPPAPKANAEFWAYKLSENRSRDASVEERLTAEGWEVLIVWEHEIRPDPWPRADELARTIQGRRSARQA
jgi:DNA mismatch endonuclease, patch repair protein